MSSPRKLVELRATSEKKLRSPSSPNPSFIVNNRTKSFKNDFLSTYNQSKRSSNVYDLASSIYNKKGRKGLGLSLKNLKGSKTTNPQSHRKQIKQKNLDLLTSNNSQTSDNKRMSHSLVQTPPAHLSFTNSLLFQNLNKRTTMLVEYRKQIFELEKQKQQKLNHIADLKRKIMNEKKSKSKLIIKSDKHMNGTEYGFDYQNKIHRQIFRNKQCQEQNEQECKKLVNELIQSNKINDETNKNIQNQKSMIQALKNDISYLIHTVFTENQELVNLKSNLTIGLKSMKNSHDMIKYLESQKADLLLFVNDQIQENAKAMAN